MPIQKYFPSTKFRLLFLLPVIAVGYLVIINFLPSKASYSLTVGDVYNSENNGNLTVDLHSLSNPVIDEGHVARLFIKPHVQIYFKPDIKIQPSYTLSVSALIKSEEDIELAIDCEDCNLPPEKISYDEKTFKLYEKEPTGSGAFELRDIGNGWGWATANIPLKDLMDYWGNPIIKKLKLTFYAPEKTKAFALNDQLEEAGYHYIVGYDNVHIYSLKTKDEMKIPAVMALNYQDWLKYNVPLFSAIGVEDFQPLLTDFANNNQDDYLPKKISFSDLEAKLPLELTFFTQEKLRVELGDIRQFKEADSLFLTLTDPDGQLIENKEFKLESLNFSYDELWNFTKGISADFNLPKRGVYKLKITSPQNKNIIISDLRMTTNKIVIIDKLYLMKEGEFYTKIHNNTKMNIRTLEHEQAQNADKTIIINNKDRLNIDYFDIPEGTTLHTYVLTPGEYAILIPANVQISAPFLALNEEIFFTPYLFDFQPSDAADQDFILVKKSIPSIKLSDIIVDLK